MTTPNSAPGQSDEVQDAPVIEETPTTPSVDTLSHQVIAALRALNTLTQLALAESTARAEAHHQVGQLAAGLCELATCSLELSEPTESLKQAWELIRTGLADLAVVTPDESEDGEEMAEVELSSDEISRRLNLTIPPHLRQTEVSESKPAINLRRILVASLETNKDAALLTGQVAASFSRGEWHVTNLGANVPIMALTGMVMENRPSVLALVIEQGEFVAETGRLIADLRRQLFGLRIMAVGPALTEPALAERLRLDLFNPDATKADELAGQFFSPLARLGSPLRLAVELDEAQPSAQNEDDQDGPLG